MQKMVSFFVVSDGKQTCPLIPSSSLPFPSFFNCSSWVTLPPALLGSFLRLTSTSHAGIRWVRPLSPCAALPPASRRRLDLQSLPRGPRPLTLAANGGSGLPRPSRRVPSEFGPGRCRAGAPVSAVRLRQALDQEACGLVFGEAMDSQAAEGERAGHAVAAGMARGWGCGARHRARPLLLAAVPAAQSGRCPCSGRRPVIYITCSPSADPAICMSGSVPHALPSELPLVCLSYPAGRVYLNCLHIRF